jgi:four helix bundle protein
MQLEFKNELAERLYRFAIDTIVFLRDLPDNNEFKVIKYQLTKSATSPGANYEEAQGASSKADFHNKIKISLKEMRESNYWLKIILGISEKHQFDRIKLEDLISESNELSNILGSISSKTRN